MGKKSPALALFLGWLIPGAGHLYIGRKGKAVVFLLSLCITFIIGLSLGSFRNVFFLNASGRVGLATLGQLPLGLIAILTMMKTTVAGPAIDLFPNYSIGTLFTCIAGLLNILVMFNAFREARKINNPEEK
jgi:hypothetical protein